MTPTLRSLLDHTTRSIRIVFSCSSFTMQLASLSFVWTVQFMMVCQHLALIHLQYVQSFYDLLVLVRLLAYSSVCSTNQLYFSFLRSIDHFSLNRDRFRSIRTALRSIGTALRSIRTAFRSIGTALRSIGTALRSIEKKINKRADVFSIDQQIPSSSPL